MMSSAEELRYLVLAAQREGARAFAALLRPLGLTPSQAEVLTVLRDAGRPLTVRELGERLVCEGGSPSRLTATMVAAGLLERGGRDGDRRAVELSPTAAGREAAAGVAAAEAQLHAWIEQTLSPAARDRGVALLRELVAGRPAGEAVALRRATATAR